MLMGRCSCHCPTESSSSPPSESSVPSVSVSGSSGSGSSVPSTSGSGSSSVPSDSASSSLGSAIEACGCPAIPLTWTLNINSAIWVDIYASFPNDVRDVPNQVTMRSIPDLVTGEPLAIWVSDEMVSEISDPNNLLRGVLPYTGGFGGVGEGHQWKMTLRLVDPGPEQYCVWALVSFEDRYGGNPNQSDWITLQRKFTDDDCLFGNITAHVDDVWDPPESTWGGPPDFPGMNFYVGSTVEWEPA